MLKTSDVVKRLEKKLEQKLGAKTGWGRNEVMALWRECVREILEELLDETTA